MKNLFFTLSFLLTLLVSLGAQIPLTDHSQTRASKVFERVIEAYRTTPIYADQAAVRIVWGEGRDFRKETGPKLTIPNEREKYSFYRTSFRRPDDFRLVAVQAGDVRRSPEKSFPATVLAQDSDTHWNGSHSEATSSEFHTALADATRQDGWNINMTPRSLLRGFARNGLFAVGQAEEETFDGHPVWRIRLDRRNGSLFFWVDRETHLIRKSERVGLHGPTLVVITALYDIDDRRRLGRADFSRTSGGGHQLNTNVEAWSFPPVDWLAAMNTLADGPMKEKVAWKSTGSSSSRNEIERKPREPSEAPTQRLTPEQMGAIVLIKTEDGEGTGFMARIRKLPFVITNLHVLADAKDLRLTTSGGKPLQMQAAFAAKGHDIAILRVAEIPAELPLAADVLDSRIGDEVVVVGNRLGGGVLTQEVGRIIGIGPDRIEVDAEFQPGNSGSPILNLRTGEVIGVASYLQKVSVIGREQRATTDEKEKFARELTTRWFGFRFDSVAEWEGIDWSEWRRQTEVLRNYNERSEAILALLQDQRRVYLKDSEMRAIMERFERDVRRNPSDDFWTRRIRELIVDLVNFSRRDAPSLDGRFYNYFQTSAYFDSSIRLQKKFRHDLTEYLEELERDVRGRMFGQ